VIVRWLHRVAIVGAVTVSVLAITTEARADVTVPLAGPLPVTAADGPDCESGNGRPYPRLDLWRFGLPGDVGEFEEVRLGFLTTGGAAATRTIGSSNIDGSTAWLVTEPGWTLVTGTATITEGTAAFMLIEACRGTQTAEGLFAINAPVQSRASRAPRALASGTDFGATVTLGSTLVLAGVLLLVVGRRPRRRHRGRPAEH
jgi:hypothetical protein